MHVLLKHVLVKRKIKIYTIHILILVKNLYVNKNFSFKELNYISFYTYIKILLSLFYFVLKLIRLNYE